MISFVDPRLTFAENHSPSQVITFPSSSSVPSIVFDVCESVIQNVSTGLSIVNVIVWEDPSIENPDSSASAPFLLHPVKAARATARVKIAFFIS